MRKVSAEHFFTVRGRGFTGRQWDEILRIVRQIVDRGAEAGIRAKFDGNARKLEVSPDGGGEPLVVWCKGEPGIPRSIKAEGRFDVLVQSVLTAIKKVAPDLFVITAEDGRDYRRVLAKGQGAWSRMKRLNQIPKNKEEAFLKAMAKQKWRHPDTHNMVEFVSLPKKEQTKLRYRWEQEFGDQYEKARAKAERKVEQAERKVEQAERAVEEAHEESEQAQEAKGLTPEKKATMNDDTIRRAAIRVAHTTQDPTLKKQLLQILRDTTPRTAADEKESRHEEGKAIDVGTWLKENGFDEAAARWEKHEGEIGKSARKSPVAAVFPEIRELAWKATIAFAHANPSSKTASVSTASRVAAADRLALKWVHDAVRNGAQVRARFGLPERGRVAAADLDAAIEKAAGSTGTLAALLLTRALDGAKVAGDDAWLNKKAFAKAATEVWGTEHVAKQWIQDAIDRPGRVREYLKVPEGEDIPMSKLDAAIEKQKGSGNKSLLSALLLAKRLKKMHKGATAA